MTIVYCIFSLTPPGGMQRALTVKANYLAGLPGYDVHIITRSVPSEKTSFSLASGIKIHHTGHEYSKNQTQSNHSIQDNHGTQNNHGSQTNRRTYKKRLSGLLFSIRPDIVISLYGDESRFLYKIGDGSKKILEFHFTRNHLVHLVKGLPNIRFKTLRLQYVRLLQYLDTRCAKHYDRLILLTEGDRALWGQPSNAVVIPNPLSFTSPVKSNLQSKRILSAGRLIATKGFDMLIDAFRHVADRYPDWKLSIYGEGQDHRFLLDRIHDQGLEDQVEILPPTSDIAAEMLRSAIYAAPSRYEGFGLVITEAMECGVPSVAFDCECGPREIISDGVDGLLIEPQNIEKFAAALIRLISSPELRTRMGSNAITSAARFAPHRIMDHWTTLFHSLVAENRTIHAH